MKPSNFTNSSGAMSNLIKILPNGLDSQFSSLSGPQTTPTTNVDNSFPFPIAPFIAVTATVCATLGFVVCGARLLYNRINSRRANGDNNIEVAVLQLQPPQQGGQVEMSILPRTTVFLHNDLSGAVSVSADLIGPSVNNQMPLPQLPLSLGANDLRGGAPSMSPLFPSPLPTQSPSRG